MISEKETAEINSFVWRLIIVCEIKSILFTNNVDNSLAPSGDRTLPAGNTGCKDKRASIDNRSHAHNENQW